MLISSISSSSSKASACSTMRAHPVVLVADDPAVAGGVGHPGGEHRAGGVGRAVAGDEGGDGLGPQQRRVAGSTRMSVSASSISSSGRAVRPDAHGVAGAPLDVLLDEVDDQVGLVLLELLGDPLGAVADDHDRPLGSAVADRVEHVEQHRPAAQQVQRLRSVRAHPGALAGGEDERGERTLGHPVLSNPLGDRERGSTRDAGALRRTWNQTDTSQGATDRVRRPFRGGVIGNTPGFGPGLRGSSPLPGARSRDSIRAAPHTTNGPFDSRGRR